MNELDKHAVEIKRLLAERAKILRESREDIRNMRLALENAKAQGKDPEIIARHERTLDELELDLFVSEQFCPGVLSMTEREKKLQNALETVIANFEICVDSKCGDGFYCYHCCPVRYERGNCPADQIFEDIDANNGEVFYRQERDYAECRKLQMEEYVNKANYND